MSYGNEPLILLSQNNSQVRRSENDDCDVNFSPDWSVKFIVVVLVVVIVAVTVWIYWCKRCKQRSTEHKQPPGRKYRVPDI